MLLVSVLPSSESVQTSFVVSVASWSFSAMSKTKCIALPFDVGRDFIAVAVLALLLFTDLIGMVIRTLATVTYGGGGHFQGRLLLVNLVDVALQPRTMGRALLQVLLPGAGEVGPGLGVCNCCAQKQQCKQAGTVATHWIILQ